MSDEELGLLLDDAEAVLARTDEFVARCKAIDALRRPQGRRVGRVRLETCRRLAPLVDELRVALLALAEPKPSPIGEAVKAEHERFLRLTRGGDP